MRVVYLTQKPGMKVLDAEEKSNQLRNRLSHPDCKGQGGCFLYQGGLMKYFMIIICCLILTACGTQQTDKLVIGLIKPSMNHLPVQYALDNISGEQKNYQFEYFHSGWETNEALVAGRIDLAIMPFTYAWMDVSQDKKSEDHLIPGAGK